MRNYIFDTDLGSDCDDCGALAVLCNAVKKEEARLLCVTHCTSDLYGAYGCRAILDWFGVSCPVGQTTRTGFQEEGAENRYARPMMEDYLRDHAPVSFPPAIPILRKALAENRNVTMIFVGPLNHMQELLLSQADDSSPLNGVQLVKQSVDQVVVMGGHFTDPDYAEWNIKCDVPAAQCVSDLCPVPVVYCGFEAGEKIFTGESLYDCPEHYPVRVGYWHFFGQNPGARNSWDPVTVYYALYPERDWEISVDCSVSFDDQGRTLVTDGTGARYVRYRDEEWLKQELNRIMGLCDDGSKPSDAV